MKELIVGDIHTKFEFIEKILSKIENNYDHIIFLGDFFDSFFDNIEINEKTAVWLKQNLCKPNRIFLYGNHDIHYKFYKNRLLTGSGYSKDKADVINKILTKEDWNKLKFFHISQNFIFSHAGFHQGLLHLINGFDENYIYGKIMKEYFELNNSYIGSYFEIGKARGGNLTKGGIFWQDWELEFEPINGINQIIGHTPGKFIRYCNYNNSINVCIDTNLKYLLEIEDGKLNEIKLY